MQHERITCDKGTIPPALRRLNPGESWTQNILFSDCLLFWALSWLLFPLDEDNPATVQLHLRIRKLLRSGS